MTRVKPSVDDKALSEQLVAEHLEMELVKEGIVTRTPEGLVFEGPRYNYFVELRTFRVPNPVRFSEKRLVE